MIYQVTVAMLMAVAWLAIIVGVVLFVATIVISMAERYRDIRRYYRMRKE